MTIRKILRAPKLPVWSISEPVDKGEWDRARLFSVSAIGSGDERERRAVSAVLSVMSGVREFGREMVRRSGGPVGTIETFIEPEFDWQEKRYRPDGLLRVTRGAKTWTALIEAKSSTAKLTAEQVQIYVDIARSLGFDAVITVSIQLPGADDEHPVKVDRRKLKKVALHHLSWDEIRSVAISMSMHKQVEDSSQGWVLREFVQIPSAPEIGSTRFYRHGAPMGTDPRVCEDKDPQCRQQGRSRGLPYVRSAGSPYRTRPLLLAQCRCPAHLSPQSRGQHEPGTATC